MEEFTLTPTIGQQNCGKFDFKVGEIGLNSKHPQTGELLPAINTGGLNIPVDYLTGFSMKLQDDKPRVRSINDIYINNISGVPNRLTYNIGYPDHEGVLRQYQCPKGSAMAALTVWGDETTGAIQMHCKDLTTGKVSSTPVYGDTVGNGAQQIVQCGPKEVVVSLEGKFNQESDGSSGDRLCGIRMGCRDYTPEMNVLRTDQGKLDCCMGRSTAGVCGLYQPGQPTCETWMKNYCMLNPKAPECACINSPVATSGKYNPVCVDSKCITVGYQPKNMLTARGTQCPSVTECNMILDMKNNYGLIDFQDAKFAQTCSSGGGSQPSTVEKPTSGPGTVLEGKTKKDYTLYIVLAFIFFVFFSLIIATALFVGGTGSSEEYPSEVSGVIYTG